MRIDTREIAELMEKAVDCVEDNRFEDCLRILVTIERLLARWVERHLTP